MKRIIVTGSRGFNDYTTLAKRLDDLFSQETDVLLLCGNDGGTDELVHRYCREQGIKFEIYTTDWGAYQQAALFVRNKHMLFGANACILFWDGESRGTKLLQDQAKKMDVHCLVEKVTVKERNRKPTSKKSQKRVGA